MEVFDRLEGRRRRESRPRGQGAGRDADVDVTDVSCAIACTRPAGCSAWRWSRSSCTARCSPRWCLAPGGWLSHAARRAEDGDDDLARRRQRRTGQRRHDPIGGRPVQVADAARRAEAAEPIRPPAAKTPEMTRADSRPDAEQGARRPRRSSRRRTRRAARTPTRGAETRDGIGDRRDRRARPGLRPVDRRRRRLRLDARRRRLLLSGLPRSTWSSASAATGTQRRGERRGDRRSSRFSATARLANASVEKIERLRRARHQRAPRASLVTRQLPPLPAGFPNPTLTVHLNFQYTR